MAIKDHSFYKILRGGDTYYLQIGNPLTAEQTTWTLGTLDDAKEKINMLISDLKHWETQQ